MPLILIMIPRRFNNEGRVCAMLCQATIVVTVEGPGGAAGPGLVIRTRPG